MRRGRKGYDAFTFEKSIPVEGYRWLRGRPYCGNGRRRFLWEEETWLLCYPRIRAEVRQKRFDALRVSGLYREFAGVREEDRVDVLAFANQWGLLGEAGLVQAITEEGHPAREWGEPYDTWVDQVPAMRNAVNLWDLLLARDYARLAEIICRKKASFNRDWWYVGPGATDIDWVKAENSDPGDVFTPGVQLLNKWVNARLRGHVSPHLEYDLEDGNTHLQMVPHDLIGCLWLQLALAIAGKKETRACKECSRWFEVSAEKDGRTARKVFCSERCKSRDYRRSKERANELYEEGKSVKEVARLIGKDEETVRGWLPTQRRKSK